MATPDSITLIVKPSDELYTAFTTSFLFNNPSDPHARILKLRVVKMGACDPGNSRLSTVINEFLEFPFLSFVSANGPALAERTIRFPAEARSEFLMLHGVQEGYNLTSLVWQQMGFSATLTNKPACLGLTLGMEGSEIKASYRFLNPSEELEFRRLTPSRANWCVVM